MSPASTSAVKAPQWVRLVGACAMAPSLRARHAVTAAVIDQPSGWYRRVDSPVTSRYQSPEVTMGSRQSSTSAPCSSPSTTCSASPTARSSTATSRRTTSSGRRTRSSTAGCGWRPASRAFSAWRCPRSTAAAAIRDFRYNVDRHRGDRRGPLQRPRLRPAQRRRRAVSAAAGHRGAEAALAARVLHRRIHHRDRDDRAGHRQRPAGHQDPRGQTGRPLRPQRRPRRSSPTASTPTW